MMNDQNFNDLFKLPNPYEVCLKYSQKEIDVATLIAVLTVWDYVIPEKIEHDYFDDLRFDTPGSFDDVGRASEDKLIEFDVYDRILENVAFVCEKSKNMNGKDND